MSFKEWWCLAAPCEVLLADPGLYHGVCGLLLPGLPVQLVVEAALLLLRHGGVTSAL